MLLDRTGSINWCTWLLYTWHMIEPDVWEGLPFCHGFIRPIGSDLGMAAVVKRRCNKSRISNGRVPLEQGDKCVSLCLPLVVMCHGDMSPVRISSEGELMNRHRDLRARSSLDFLRFIFHTDEDHTSFEETMAKSKYMI